MNKYTIGQIFTYTYPPEVAQWCNTNGAYIKEIEPITCEEVEEVIVESCYDDDGELITPADYQEWSETKIVRRFQIAAIPKPTEIEKAKARIAELEIYLTNTDWYAVRYAETNVPVPENIRQARANAREEISTLREISV